MRSLLANYVPKSSKTLVAPWFTPGRLAPISAYNPITPLYLCPSISRPYPLRTVLAPSGRYHLLVRLMLAKAGGGFRPGLLGSYLAEPVLAAGEGVAIVEVPDFRNV